MSGCPAILYVEDSDKFTLIGIHVGANTADDVKFNITCTFDQDLHSDINKLCQDIPDSALKNYIIGHTVDP